MQKTLDPSIAAWLPGGKYHRDGMPKPNPQPELSDEEFGRRVDACKDIFELIEFMMTTPVEPDPAYEAMLERMRAPDYRGSPKEILPDPKAA